ncbi:MAG: Uma2 family endonuclease [Rubrivivax sp.]|jgi:hypothetical protein|nr:Uma2 family endonuclease [Rubrivivax sp.]
MSAVLESRPTLEAFLEWENAQPGRHEFHAGEVVGRVGARRVHGRVTQNLARRFAERLDGSPCRVFAGVEPPR